jgi:hypothetical protein
MAFSQRRTRVWSPKEVPLGVAITVLGIWAAIVPLVGPYFSWGFDTGNAWNWSEPHWTLSIVPGIAAALAGLAISVPARGLSNMGRSLAAISGFWFLVGNSLHQIWDGVGYAPVSPDEWKRAFLWITYYYGVGGFIVLFAGYAGGLVTPRQRIQETVVGEPQIERTVTGD